MREHFLKYQFWYGCLLISIVLFACTLTIVSRLGLKNGNTNKIVSDSGFVKDSDRKSCKLPAIWDEIGLIFHDCSLKQVYQFTNRQDYMTFPGGNGSFSYCNTLIFRKYDGIKGRLYTYEKITGKHYPNSDVGEYRIPELLYNEMVNSPNCREPRKDPPDDDISSRGFPSGHYQFEEQQPEYNASFFNRHYPEYEWGKKKLQKADFHFIKHSTN